MSGAQKRKSRSKQDEQPNKKQQFASNVNVRHVDVPDLSKAVIASSPGISVPQEIKFKLYSKKSKDDTSEVLLHASDHPTIDYTATEGASPGDRYVKHYVAVYEPKSGSLQVTEARHLILRRSVRQIQAISNEDEEEQNKAITNYSSRAALTEAFGTKKSRKAVQSMAENRQLAHGNESMSITDAMSAHLPDVEDPGQAAPSRSHKPLPKPNLMTSDIEQVYPLEELVFPQPMTDILQLLHPHTWVSRLGRGKEITDLRSRFVANRIGYIGKALLASPNASDPKLVQLMQLLRYIGLLIEINTYVSRGHPRKAILSPDKWKEDTLSPQTPFAVVNPIVNHFFPDRLPTTHALTLLRTTILALALHIPPPSLQPGAGMLITEPTDLRLDLALDEPEMRKFYRELGCKYEKVKEKELQLWKLEKIRKNKKDDSSSRPPAPYFAKLILPLDFPQISRGRQAQRR